MPLRGLRFFALFVVFVTLIGVFSAGGVASSQSSADLTDTAITIGRDATTRENELRVTVTLRNTGAAAADGVTVAVPMPDGVTFVNSSTVLHPYNGTLAFGDDYVEWSGSVPGRDIQRWSFKVAYDPVATRGEFSTVATVSSVNEALVISADAPLGEEASLMFFPYAARFPTAPILSLTAPPNANNSWSLSWDPTPFLALMNISPTAEMSYELQETQDPSFGNATTTPYNTTSATITNPRTNQNVYYYRARVLVDGLVSPWSNVVTVVGGYYDDFTGSSTDWDVVRTTYIEEVNSFLENDKLVLSVQDKWDWGITSPLKRAPAPPYVIEYKALRVSNGNLIAHGLVAGGDLNTPDCPFDASTLPGIYEHTDCFNQFYNFTWINRRTDTYQQMKTTVESVGQLVWCPECGQSPMKRINPAYPGNNAIVYDVEVPSGFLAADGWNTYNYEVYPDRIEMYVNGNYISTITDASWVNQPYFGFYMATDEYNNSTWRIEYIDIKPIDQ